MFFKHKPASAFCFVTGGTSRSGVNPEPTVIVRMEENDIEYADGITATCLVRFILLMRV